MKYARELFTSTLVGGMFVVVPVYLAVLLLLKGMKSAAPWCGHSQRYFLTGSRLRTSSSLVLVLAFCFVVGVAVRTRTGRAIRERMEMVFFERLPGLRPAAQSDTAFGRGQ